MHTQKNKLLLPRFNVCSCVNDGKDSVSARHPSGPIVLSQRTKYFQFIFLNKYFQIIMVKVWYSWETKKLCFQIKKKHFIFEIQILNQSHTQKTKYLKKNKLLPPRFNDCNCVNDGKDLTSAQHPSNPILLSQRTKYFEIPISE